MTNRPTWARWVTRVSLVVGLAALVWTVQRTGLQTIGTYFRRIGWWWFVVVLMEVSITSLDALAIRSFMSPEQDKIKLRHALLAQLAGRAVNAVTPSGNIGEAIKVSILTEHVSQSRAVSTILLYNVVSFTVELAVVAAAAPIMALLVPMSSGLRTGMIITGCVCFVLSIGLYNLARRGMLGSVARLATRIRIPGLITAKRIVRKLFRRPRDIAPSGHLLSKERYASWRERLEAVDNKVRLVEGARKRDRWLGAFAVTCSRLTSMSLSLMILHAIGETITPGFVAALTVGGFVIYMASTLVPMGLGISEGGNYWLFRALGGAPDAARGVALVYARQIVYAAIGLVLVTANETVKRARAKGRAASPVLDTVAEITAPIREVRDVAAE
jgi:uncharacterized protein (TIRG00374 family)